MKIDEQTLNTIEKLSKISIDENERDLTIKKLVGVLNILDKINMNNIVDLEPLYHPLEISQPLRNDIADPAIDREALQAGTPLVAQGLFLVPKIIE